MKQKRPVLSAIVVLFFLGIALFFFISALSFMFEPVPSIPSYKMIHPNIPVAEPELQLLVRVVNIITMLSFGGAFLLSAYYAFCKSMEKKFSKKKINSYIKWVGYIGLGGLIITIALRFFYQVLH